MMMRPPSRIHHANRRNPLTHPAKSKSDSPVALHGPIVMNTQAELQTAMRELNNGTFIKTGAAGW